MLFFLVHKLLSLFAHLIYQIQHIIHTIQLEGSGRNNVAFPDFKQEKSYDPGEQGLGFCSKTGINEVSLMGPVTTAV